jgi:UPF0042 nucleotide-binding protein
MPKPRRNADSIESFGFKHGPAHGADLVFDVRFLPNPNYDREIGHLDGFCQPVIDYVMREPVTGRFLEKWEDFITFLVPEFEKEGKAYLHHRVGCTGGRHRSVALTNWLAAHSNNAAFAPTPRTATWCATLHRPLMLPQQTQTFDGAAL